MLLGGPGMFCQLDSNSFTLNFYWWKLSMDLGSGCRPGSIDLVILYIYFILSTTTTKFLNLENKTITGFSFLLSLGELK